MIKKYIRFIFLFVLIYCSLYIYKIVIREENIRNTYMHINEYYLLSSFGWDEESNSVFLKIVNKKTYNSCIIVQDLFNYEDKYVVGKVGIENYDYLDCEEELKYKGYFYINFDNKNDAKFNLTEKEIKNKFSSQIKYLKARKWRRKFSTSRGSNNNWNIFTNIINNFFYNNFKGCNILFVKFKNESKALI